VLNTVLIFEAAQTEAIRVNLLLMQDTVYCVIKIPIITRKMHNKQAQNTLGLLF